MSAVYLVLLLLSASTTAVLGTLALVAVRGLRREVAGFRAQLSDAAVPAARSAPGHPFDTAFGNAESALRRRAEIRDAVSEALAEERERELAEARAFWAAQEAHENGEGLRSVPPHTGIHGPFDEQFTEALREAIEELAHAEGACPVAEDQADDGPDAPAAVPDMRRHPSHPQFKPAPVVADGERVTDRLGELAEAGTPLADVRPGPLGTLDIYVFGDGTTLCLTPGSQAATERLTDALREGETALLLGGSGIAGAYALTFGVGEESVFVLADRVVASY